MSMKDKYLSFNSIETHDLLGNVLSTIKLRLKTATFLLTLQSSPIRLIKLGYIEFHVFVIILHIYVF